MRFIPSSRRGFAVASAACIAAVGAGIAGAGTAHAATTPAPLHVTFSASNDGAGVQWDAQGNPVLQVGSTPSSTYAQVQVAPASMGDETAPATPPSFTTSDYNAGSPRWVLELANGNWIDGYPAQLDSGATGDFTGAQWSPNGHGVTSSHGPYETYQQALADVNDALGNVQVTSAYIVADGDQTSSTPDTLTDVQYGGATIQETASNAVTVTNRHSLRCLNEGAGVLSQYACNVAGNYKSLQWKVVTFADGTKALQSVATGGYAVDNGQGGQLSLSPTVFPGSLRLQNGGIFRFPDNLVMDVKAMSKANGAQVIGWTYNGQDNQRWDFANAPS